MAFSFARKNSNPPAPPPPPAARPFSRDNTPPAHSPPPNISTEWKHDVFVSYRGEDIKKNFRAHLFDALKERDIDYFWDDDPEGRGQEVRAEIFGAIPCSRVALVVLSSRYADSKWCLDELVAILKCKNEHNVHDHGTVLPIFFGVSVGDVMKQEGEFGKGFKRVKKGKTKDQVNGWTGALARVGALGGLHLENDCNWDESLLIEKILDWLSSRDIPDRYVHMGRDVVGRDQEVEDLISTCKNIREQKDACVIGIYGIKDVGKTRLAKLVVSRIYREFKYVGFLENIRNESQGVLVEKLLQVVSTKRRPLQYDLEGKILHIYSKLGQAKTLLVFDDVDHRDKVEKFLDRKRFSPGSIILLTARDERLLNELKVDDRYMVSALSSKGSLQLFSRHVFDANEPGDGYKELSENLCHYTGGLPRALEKLGSHIRCSNKSNREEWTKTLEKLVRNPCIDYVGSNPFKVGPFPRTRLSSFDDRKYSGIRQIKVITVGSMIESITPDYDQYGCLVRPDQYGGSRQGKTETIKLDYPREYLTSISGHINMGHNPDVIQSLKIRSNVKEYGPYGAEKGNVFVFPKVDYAKIIGFHGNSGASLHSIGAYFGPISDHFPFNKVEPFGGQDGEEWDDGRHTDIRQIDVVFGSDVESISIWYDDRGRPTGETKHGESAGGKLHSVKLDYPYEYLTSISGYTYTTENSRQVRVSSITLQSNLNTFGPFGTETGQQYSFPAKCGKIVGFHGTCLEQHLESIGAHFELVSHLYPFKKLGPFGGESGEIWDDGKHSDIKQIIIKYGSAINAIICEYDNPDKVLVHGGNGDLYELIKLDYPDEYITAMCGYIAEETQSVVNSITFQSNRRIWGPFGTEKGTFFSLPLNSGKTVGFFGRTDGCHLNSIGAHVKLYSSKQYQFKSVGLFGGGDGEKWDDGRFFKVRQIEIVVKDSVVKSINFDYETDEGLLQNEPHGPDVEGKTHTITIGQDEYLTSLSGYYNADGGCIQSLTFQSNKRTCGPYGVQTGKYFSAPSTGGKVVGFYGRSNCFGLISIGAHFIPISHLYPAKRIGPFGSEDGDLWSDENSNAVRVVRVLSDKAGIVRIYALYEKNGRLFWSSGCALDESSRWKVDTVTLDHPNEYLTSISGYIRDYSDPIMVRSLILHSNKRSYGPYGKKTPKGSYFWFPSTGGKIVSFYGNCVSSHLSSIGVYTEPISHLYPTISIGPFGGQQGKRWDDGTFTAVREIHILYGTVIVAFSVEYDNNGSPARRPEHGNDRSYMACVGSAEATEGGLWRQAKRARPSHEVEPKSVSIKLDFPKEHLVLISGYTGNELCEEVVRSLTVKTNLRTYRTRGTPKGKYFQLPEEENCGRIIGFHGTSGRYLNSLGARLESF